MPSQSARLSAQPQKPAIDLSCAIRMLTEDYFNQMHKIELTDRPVELHEIRTQYGEKSDLRLLAPLTRTFDAMAAAEEKVTNPAAKLYYATVVAGQVIYSHYHLGAPDLARPAEFFGHYNAITNLYQRLSTHMARGDQQPLDVFHEAHNVDDSTGHDSRRFYASSCYPFGHPAIFDENTLDLQHTRKNIMDNMIIMSEHLRPKLVARKVFKAAAGWALSLAQLTLATPPKELTDKIMAGHWAGV